MVVEFFEVVVGGLGGFRSFHVLVTTTFKHLLEVAVILVLDY